MATNDDYQLFLKKMFKELIDKLDLEEHQRDFLMLRWLDQVIWLEKKAIENQWWHFWFRRINIVLSALVPALVGITFFEGNARGELILKSITVILSVIVAVITGLGQFFRYGDKWNLYRKTAEGLKGEFWAFYTRSGIYGTYKTHTDGFMLFANHSERIIDEDVRVYTTEIAPDKKDKKNEF